MQESHLAELVASLQVLQRKRTVAMKGRIAQNNYLRAVVAGTLGYTSHLAEKDRRKLFKEADSLIAKVVKGKKVLCKECSQPLRVINVLQAKVVSEYAEIILASWEGIEALRKVEADLVDQMEELAAQLPVAAWVEEENQRGFGLLSLAVVIGEAGNLSRYAGPAKLWRRMGCAPYVSEGQERMGSTWKSGREGKLSKSEWETYGYSPRRCSLMYVIGENLVRGNKGEYRQRYVEAKAAAKENHPDWSKLRCHRHAMLLARKRLLRNLWRAWRDHKPEREWKSVTEDKLAVLA